ncbi:peroxiredoxin [Paludibacterium yongneupense]|uniref:peroxiredoxin n=1 Tax=Paludibacterium yongneupense TaxID=400061 RepID=UPI000418AF12|nr:peroxiredoxin [Paludibacterium yongneupense]
MPDHSCPDFVLPATSGTTFSPATAGKPLVIYFYPKDNTPGCTNESIAFRDLHPEFLALGADIVGISRDSLKSHENFKSKFGLPFELASDTEEIACNLFDVIKMKSMYGKQVRGIQRSTFVIDGSGQLIREWRGVKVEGHAAEVLEFVKTL